MITPVMESAQLWLSRGISPIPLYPMTKFPMFKWKKWASELPTQKHLDIWFKDSRNNIAVCCGMKNLVVIDFDDIEKYREYIDDLSDNWWFLFTNTYNVRTSRGIHIYFYCNKMPVAHAIRDKMIDIKSTGFVLVPPSTHPSGTKYSGINTDVLTVESLEDLFPTPAVYANIGQKHACPVVNESGNEYSWDVHIDENDIDLDDINKIPMLDVARWYTQMHQVNSRFWYGVCPAHDDKHPSFRVDIELNKCKCLSTQCKLNGDLQMSVLDFYATMENIDKKTAFSQLRKVVSS